jgi:nicotinamidase-related amidase
VTDLPYGPLPADTVHLCVDMQRLFAEGCSWASGAVREALPDVLRLCDALPERTVLTRFLTPPSLGHAKRGWLRYYERWRDVVGDRLDPGLLDLVPELAARAAPGRVVDKPTYSAFAGGRLDPTLRHLGAGTLVVSGVETDMCVLATLLGAVDQGYRCVVASDAVASSSRPAHDVALQLLAARFTEQVELAATADVLAALPPAAGR